MAVVLVAVLFGLLHARAGATSMVNAAAIELLYGSVYLGTGRNLWVVVLTHSLYDTIRVLQYHLA